jgi:hypothetical protein
MNRLVKTLVPSALLLAASSGYFLRDVLAAGAPTIPPLARLGAQLLVRLAQ